MTTTGMGFVIGGDDRGLVLRGSSAPSAGRRTWPPLLEAIDRGGGGRHGDGDLVVVNDSDGGRARSVGTNTN